MLIDKYIENALYLYQCVIIPGFGGFIATDQPQDSAGKEGKYSPRKKKFAFHPNLKVNDGVLAMYHDQGLIPFKTIAFEDGVNFTAGLPKVRTSPDHGTAYDIAGKGLADESSMRAAVYRAIDILRNRSLYRAMTQNPLRTRRGADVHEGEDEDIDINHVED